MSTYVGISFQVTACNCPFCGAYSQISWEQLYVNRNGIRPFTRLVIGTCSHCQDSTIWLNKIMIFPITGNIPLPNSDLPDEVKYDYLEAAQIVNLSPRGAVALLRLSIQKLCKALGEKGENINTDIKNLVSKGLQPVIQQALDSLRVIGNNAVHPGQIDLKDDVETANKLFAFINIIATTLITQPRQIAEFYHKTIPEDAKAAIIKRDASS